MSTKCFLEMGCSVLASGWIAFLLGSGSRFELPRYVHVRWLIIPSDEGPDQTACDKLISEDIRSQLLTLKVKPYCKKHKSQIVVTKRCCYFFVL